MSCSLTISSSWFRSVRSQFFHCRIAIFSVEVHGTGPDLTLALAPLGDGDVMYDLLLQATWSLWFFHLIRCCLCGKLYSDFVGEIRERHIQNRKNYGLLERSTLVAPAACWWNLRCGEMRPAGRRDDEMSVTVLLSFGCVWSPHFTRTAVTLPAINGHSHDQRDLICPRERERKGM